MRKCFVLRKAKFQIRYKIIFDFFSLQVLLNFIIFTVERVTCIGLYNLQVNWSTHFAASSKFGRSKCSLQFYSNKLVFIIHHLNERRKFLEFFSFLFISHIFFSPPYWLIVLDQLMASIRSIS